MSDYMFVAVQAYVCQVPLCLTAPLSHCLTVSLSHSVSYPVLRPFGPQQVPPRHTPLEQLDA
jgi:hypothetical protein